MQILRLMSDGRFHSGESLGRELGISRTAIWKQLKQWQQKGLLIDVVPGKGYRWRNPVEWWSENELRSHMSPAAASLLYSLQIEQSVTSTNTVVLDRLLRERRSGVVCLAEEQTEGRGRRGRQWLAPLGGGFYGSIGWFFDAGVAALEGLSLAVGLAVARALNRYGVEGVGLKWPNDIMHDDAKMGGILIEMHLDSDGGCFVVVGMGVNFAVTAEVQSEVGRKVTDVQRHLAVPRLERNRLGGAILDEVLLMLSGYGQGSFALLRDEWCRLDVLRDREVELQGVADAMTGVARGVNASGALLLDTREGQRNISSGEVSLKRL